MGGGGAGFPFTMPGLPIATGSAGFEDVDDMKACVCDFEWLEGAYWFGYSLLSVSTTISWRNSPVNNVPRSANAVACRVVENMAAMCEES